MASYEWIKDASFEEIQSYLHELFPAFHWHTKPRIYQAACFALGLSLEDFLFFLDMGAGKTKIALDIIYNRMRSGDFDKALIVVPTFTNIETWKQECAKHAPSMRWRS